MPFLYSVMAPLKRGFTIHAQNKTFMMRYAGILVVESAKRNTVRQSSVVPPFARLGAPGEILRAVEPAIMIFPRRRVARAEDASARARTAHRTRSPSRAPSHDTDRLADRERERDHEVRQPERDIFRADDFSVEQL